MVGVSDRKRRSGFTLIEIAIVLAILGILVAIIVPNLGRITGSSIVESANTEARSIKAAALSYYTDHDSQWPESSADLVDYYTGELKGTYTFEGGYITAADAGGWGGGIEWDYDGQVWVNKTTAAP